MQLVHPYVCIKVTNRLSLHLKFGHHDRILSHSQRTKGQQWRRRVGIRTRNLQQT